MKKIYLLNLLLSFTLFISAAESDRVKVVFTKGDVVTNEFNHNGWYGAGEIKQGEVINVAGTYDMSADGHDVFAVMINFSEMNAWSTVTLYDTYMQGGHSDNPLTGSFDYDVVIPFDAKLGADFETGEGNLNLIQVRIIYGDNSVTPVGQVNTYVNCAPVVTAGDAASSDRLKVVFTHGDNVTQEQNHDGWWSAGQVKQGDIINVAGTYDMVANGYDATGFTITLSEMAAWVPLKTYTFYQQGSDSGNELTGSFNYDIQIPYDAKLSDDFESGAGNLNLIQVKVAYDDNKLPTFANAAPIIIAGTPTSNNINLASQVTVFPNPIVSGNNLHVSGLSFENDANIQIINVVGSIVKVIKVTNAEEVIALDLVPGLYSLLISDGVDSIVEKIIVK